MANVTDPLARAIHGTNPQNLIECITRQKIYDSQYWKEECFGLSAVDITEKAALQIKAVGGSYGGNSKPTRFLCLVLKMLQIQPDDDIVLELVRNADFKYVRALGAFYLRLTGRPADIYDNLEPLYEDYRPLRRRDATEWNLITMDEFVDDLLREERVCGIALPRLPKREVLEEGGYLDGPRRSKMLDMLEEESPRGVEDALVKMAKAGNEAAREALDTRGKLHLVDGEKKNADMEAVNMEKGETNETDHGERRNMTPSRTRSRSRSRDREESSSRRHHDEHDDRRQGNRRESKRHDRKKDKHRSERKKKKDKKKTNKYGSLFKKSSNDDEERDTGSRKATNENSTMPKGGENGGEEKSEEYWNAERAKLGLKPLKK